jgi:hypothetical protein
MCTGSGGAGRGGAEGGGFYYASKARLDFTLIQQQEMENVR